MKKNSDHLAWKTISRKWLNDFRIFNIYQVQRETAGGMTGTFYEVDAPNWVTIIPHITDEKLGSCFLMVRQYRHGSNEITLEFPAGMVEKGEAAEFCAGRELLEETGYQAGLLELIGEVSPNPAFMNNSVSTFLADGLELTREQELDEHELIDIIPVPVSEVLASMGQGEYNNGIMMISLGFYLRRMNLIKTSVY
ncbi:MAG: NUDIX hydrolase [Bacteroidetes bacterium]|nr:NUDIX hydrolase [Bacteroidota bacterium]